MVESTIRIKIFLDSRARQNIALRDHEENLDSLNKGNFLELLELQKENVPILYEKFSFSYTSVDIQNQIIEFIGSEIKKIIIDEFQNRPFSVIADETPDISNNEQVSVCIRYVNKDLEIRERFIGVFKVETPTGEELDKIILAAIQNFGLSARDFLVGQGYDREPRT